MLVILTLTTSLAKLWTRACIVLVSYQCLYLILKSELLVSIISCSLSFFFLLFLQCQLRFVALLYHYLMVQGKHSVPVNFVLIILFIPCLNSSTNTLSSKLLSLTAFLNSCTNSSIMILPLFY